MFKKLCYCLAVLANVSCATLSGPGSQVVLVGSSESNILREKCKSLGKFRGAGVGEAFGKNNSLLNLKNKVAHYGGNVVLCNEKYNELTFMDHYYEVYGLGFNCPQEIQSSFMDMTGI